MKLRMLSMAAAAVLAVAGLSACTSKVGQAAVVEGHRLSDSSLSSYLQTGAKVYTDSASNTSVVPKLYVLESWIDDQLFQRAVEAKGGAIQAGELSTVRGLVLGTGTVADVSKYYRKLGYADRFAALFVHEQEMVVLLVKRLAPTLPDSQVIPALQSGQVGSALLAAVAKLKPDVSVSGRYGKWDAKKLSLTQTAGAGLPGFVTFEPAASGGLSSLPAPTR